jgi:lysophospholipase L1-like esterase
MLLAEAALRVWAALPASAEHPFVRFINQAPVENARTLTAAGVFFRPSQDAGIGWEPIPGAQSGRVRINSAGFRGPECAPTPPAGVTRVVVLGDSETFGINLAERDTFPAALERRLNARQAGGFEVLNLGVPGYNTANQLALLKARGIRLRPQIVVLLYNFNDPEIGEPVVHVGRALWTRSYLTLLLVFRWKSLACLNDIARQAGGPVEYYRLLHDSAYFDTTARLIREMAALLAARGARMALVIDPHVADREPMGEDYPYARIHEKLKALAAANGVLACDPLPALAAASKDPTAWWISPRERHKNGLAHEIMAEETGRVILGGHGPTGRAR